MNICRRFDVCMPLLARDAALISVSIPYTHLWFTDRSNTWCTRKIESMFELECTVTGT